ncbi:polysaccharide biosynthesis/export family protein [Desulforhopalus singaporensis]|nr:polysaccharide biosynthesis/export family protein [Desulforhopalus singaporensis]
MLIVSVSFLLAGCGGEERFKETTSIEQFRQQNIENVFDKKTTTTSGYLPSESVPEVDGDDYQLGPGDLLTVKVFEAEELSAEVRVSSRGNITLPLLDDVNVANLSAAKAEQKIEDLYRRDYLVDPHVAIYIKEHMSRQITLIGAVNKPGTFDYIARRRLLDVLAMGNGLMPDAGTLAYLTRQDGETGENITYLINLADLVKNGNMAHNHVILGGDVIFVPESGHCFVDGAVRKPGTYPLTTNMTVAEAITVAGGLAGWADDDKIKLVRFRGRGTERQVVSLSYADLQAGVGDTLVLKDQDIVYAESSASGKLFSGAGFTIGFMGTGVSFRDPSN